MTSESSQLQARDSEQDKDEARSLTVIILTYNEAKHLPICLASARFADEIIVIDSGSQDGSVELARKLGAQVHVHDDWRGFGVQRTRALQYCKPTGYVFFLDADEEIPAAMKEEILAVVRHGEQAAWMVGWLQVAFGRTLTGMYSTAGMPRLFYRPCLQGFDGAVHEQALLKKGTSIHRLQHRLLHHSYETVHDSLKKLHQYAMLGASKRAAQGKKGGVCRGLISAFAGFFRLYVLRRGFLHGGPGFLYCYLLAQECFFRYAALEYDRQRLSDRVER